MCLKDINNVQNSTISNSCRTLSTITDTITTGTASETSNEKEMTGRGLTPEKLLVPAPAKQNCTMENSTRNHEVPVKSIETDKKTNTNFGENVYMYTDKKQNIKGSTLPQTSIEDSFICKPVSIDESTIKPKEQSPVYGI